VTPCCAEVGYCFGEHGCPHLQGEVKIEAARFSETMVSYYNTTWHHNLKKDAA
jgi:hypothetical protein